MRVVNNFPKVCEPDNGDLMSSVHVVDKLFSHVKTRLSCRIYQFMKAESSPRFEQ